MDVTNPTVEEIRSWAYSQEVWPHEEWDLVLSWTREVGLFIELATDHNCPHKSFFLHMLYYIVGATFGEPSKSDKSVRIKDYANKGIGINHGAIRLWRTRVEELLSGNAKYNYDDWRGGVYAGYEFT